MGSESNIKLRNNNLRLPLISIIIPTWNSKEFAISCVKSVLAVNYPYDKLDIVVVDNASKDGTVNELKRLFGRIRIIKLKRNYGFSGAINRGFKVSSGQYFIVLQCDLLVHRNYLINLITSVIHNKKSYKVFGPIIYSYEGSLESKRKLVAMAYGSLGNNLELSVVGRGETDEGQYIDSEVDCVAFSGILIEREAFERIGLMDERFFLYYEDNDFFIRMRDKGFKCRFVPKAVVFDRNFRSLGQNSPKITYYLTRNYLLLLNKNNKITISKHYKNIRFLISSFVLSLINKKKSKSNQAIFLAIIDFYLGRFGERHGKYIT